MPVAALEKTIKAATRMFAGRQPGPVTRARENSGGARLREELLGRAAGCRELCSGAITDEVRFTLLRIADEYEARALGLQADERPLID